MICEICKQHKSKAEMIGDTCYLCRLRIYPVSGYFSKILYRKAVAVSLCFNTPLTKYQAYKVVRKYGIKDMQRLADLQNGRLVKFKPQNTFFARVMGVSCELQSV